MLVQVRDNKKTLISIENYDKFQPVNYVRDMSPDMSEEQVGDMSGTQTKNDNNIIFFNLLNKYKTRARGKPFSDRIELIKEMKNEKDYKKLLSEEQNSIFYEIMGGK